MNFDIYILDLFLFIYKKITLLAKLVFILFVLLTK